MEQVLVKLAVAQFVRKSPFLTETEVSVSSSQGPAIGSYTEAAQSDSRQHVTPLRDAF
jgi:hypothetical protein